MRSLLSRGVPASRFVILGFIAVACSTPDRVSAPTIAPPSGPPSRTQSMDGAVITVVDKDDGSTYTLDVNAQEVRFSDGRVLQFDYDQTTEVLTAFHGTLQTDSIDATAFTREAGCEDPTQVICASSTRPTPVFLWRFVDKSKPSKAEAKSKNSGANGPGIQSSFDICADVAVSAANANYEYGTIRTSIWRRLFDIGVSAGVGVVTARRFPPASMAGYLAMNELANFGTYRTNLGVLALAWHGNQCSNRNVYAGPLFKSSRGGSGGGGLVRTLVCRDEILEFSLDGGATWITVSAKICEYV